MCRYGFHSYRSHYACFHCRKSFKQTHDWPINAPGQEILARPCPQCTHPLINMGHDFKPPKQLNLKQWKKVEILYRHGFAYHSCGCSGPGYRPARFNEIPDFLREQNISGSNF